MTTLLDLWHRIHPEPQPITLSKPLPEVIPMSFTGFFHSLELDFQHLFGKSANYSHYALAAITYAAPFVEGLLAIVDPAVAALVAPIITRIESSLAVAYSLSTEGAASATPLSTTLSAVSADFTSISELAGIKDPATQAKITRIISQIQAVIALIPLGTPAVPVV